MRYLRISLFLCLAAPGMALAAPEDFPRPPAIEPAVEFWTTVYAEVPTSGGLLHDRYNLSVMYEELDFGENASYRHRNRLLRERRDHYRELLREIARSDRSDLTDEAARVLAMWPEDVSDERLREAAHNIRFQLGQADKFHDGLVRAGAWEPHIRGTLRKMGLPEELAALPHVESSFNPEAYSRVGAAGIWQFTRATGKRYMRIDRVVDERMDPYHSTVAAARLLKHNHAATSDWALAITAYNHGLRGIRRGVRQVGSSAIADLIADYQDSRWGFASRNFYAAFLAAVDVDAQAEQYFGFIRRRPPVDTELVELPFYVSADKLADAFDIARERLRKLNRGLRGPVWRGEKRVPRGYHLRVPSDQSGPSPEQRLASIERDDRYFAQIPDRFHRIRRGDTLGQIATRYGVSTHELVAINDLRSSNHIRAGQRLRLPLPAAGSGDQDTYTVRRGDTLGAIARRVGMSVESLAAANGLENASRIHPGQELRIDGSPAPGVTTLAETGDPGS